MTVFTGSTMTVSLKNLADNYNTLKKQTKSRAASVVKTNAYGLGAEQVVCRLVKEGCDAFFVAHAIEGRVVRRVAPQADIYVLQGIGTDSVEDFLTYGLTPVIANPDMLRFFKNTGITGVRPIIQVETGLNRLGFHQHDIASLTPEDRQNFSYILSHLACADDQQHFMNVRQQSVFEEMRKQFNIPATLAASDGAFLGEAFHYDMVRFGASLYGLNTVQGQTTTLKPTVYVTAPVLQVSDVSAGEYVGYGATYSVKTPQKIAVVSIGYGDGLPRSLSNKGRVRINGIYAPIVGRLSMDNIMCDVTHIPSVRVGDSAHILDDIYRADDMAQDAGTIGYEILTSLGKGFRFCKSYEE
ncbi:MAG: alanine racemase [Alphaproteobacteria bacterium]|nr:alanine racemase [Alphaproteobacteria bacterium]